MPKVFLKDVVKRARDKVDLDTSNLEYYVGGEHYDSGEILIKNKGVINGSTIGPAFHMHFVPGDVLLMSRNPHLKKASMATFEGVCSNVSYICRTKDENILLQRFLPFIFQTDHFWRFAEENKKGSTNFFLNWSDFEKYEFYLPDIEEQKKQVELLWAIENTRQAYMGAIDSTVQLIKSYYVQLFGDPTTNPMKWPIHTFNDVAKVDAKMTTEYDRYADYPHIGIDSIERGTGVLSGYRTVKEDNVISGKHIFNGKHILYSKIRPNLNKVATPDFEGLCSADCYPILTDESKCNKFFFAALLRSDFFLDYILGLSVRSQMPKVNKKQLSNFRFPLPPLELQEEYVELINQSEKAILELKQSITEVSDLKKLLMEKICERGREDATI